MYFLNISLLLHLPYTRTLKDKRSYRRRIIDRLKNMNISVRESSHQDKVQVLALGISYVALSYGEAEKMKEKIIDNIYIWTGDVIILEDDYQIIKGESR